MLSAVVEIGVSPLVGIQARVGNSRSWVVSSEEQLPRGVRQCDTAAEHFEVHYVGWRLIK